jgi:hypothetical protein
MSRNPKKAGFSLLLAVCAGAAAAQTTTPVLPPVPEGLLRPLTPRMESCDAIECGVSDAQLRALDGARGEYGKEQVGIAAYSAVIGKEGEKVTVTLMPSPQGSRGIAITYVYDADGRNLIRSFPNR